MKTYMYSSLGIAINNSLRMIASKGVRIKTERWQGVSSPHEMVEVINVDFSAPMYETIGAAAKGCKPNLPWADLHFSERVGGKPTNPGETYEVWPYWRGGHLSEDKKFTHTYQERMWTDRSGFGNLGDVVDLLKREPDTRQAFLPVWFPEDTGVRSGGRVPCTIGYHFIVRGGLLYTRYYLRSCDARRHFADDIYLANRLSIWIAEKIGVHVGELTMNITSFHIFETDLYWLKKQNT